MVGGHHHVVLVELGVNGRHLTLAEGVIEHVVNRLRGNAQTRSGGAVKAELDLIAELHRLALHIGEGRVLLDRRHQLAGPFLQHLRVGGLQAEAVTGGGHAGVQGQVLHRVQVQADPGVVGIGIGQTPDHRAGAVALVTRLEVDQQIALIEGRVGLVDTDKRRQALHRRIAQNARGQALLLDLHLLERNSWRGLGNPLNQPGVLIREKALGHDRQRQHREHGGEHHRQQRQGAVRQHPVQAAHIVLVDAIKKVFAARLRVRLEHARAHHRRQGQGNHRRNHDGHGHGHGELTEQPPHYVAHEQQRDHHRNQRQRQRNDGEADLRRALERGLQRRIPLLQVTADVFDHDNGIIDHKTDGNGQRHQGQVIQRKTQCIGHRKSAEQGQGHGHGRNDRGRDIAQKQEDHQHHQHHGNRQFVLHVGDRGANGLGPVGEHRHLERARQTGAQRGQQLLHAVDHLNHISPRLALDAQHNRRGFVGPGGLARVLRALGRGGNV